MKRLVLLALASVAVVLNAATPVLAKPVSFETFEVTLHEESGRSILIVTGTLPEGTPLPADVVLTAPQGWQLQWAGEILGGDLSDDISANPRKSSASSGDAYAFTLTKSQTAQIEVMGPASTTFDGTTYRAQLSWEPPSDAPKVRMNVALPGDARIGAGTEGAEFVPVDATGGYYSKTYTDVKAGEPLELVATYSLPAAAPLAASGSSGPGGAAVAVVLVVALAFFGVAFAAIRHKMRVRAGHAGIGANEPQAADAADVAGETRAVTTAPVVSEPDVLDGGIEQEVAPAPPRRSNLPLAIVAGVIAVLVVVGFAAGSRSSATQKGGGVVSRTYSTAEACTQASIPLKAREGVDLAQSAETLLKSLEAVPGISTAALVVEESRIDIGYCDSSASEAQLRDALAATGLVTFD